MNIDAPYQGYSDYVRKEWIDRNAHMNMGYYLVVFDFATVAWLSYLGFTEAYRQEQQVTTFCLESHNTYQREVAEAAPLRFTTQLLDYDAKRIHYYHEMYHQEQGYLAATNELMSLHVSRQTRRAAPMSKTILDRLAAVKAAHDQLPPPAHAGRIIGLRAKPTTYSA